MRKEVKKQEKNSGVQSVYKRNLDVFALFRIFPEKLVDRLFWLRNIPATVEKMNQSNGGLLNLIFFTPEWSSFETASIYNGINFSAEEQIKQKLSERSQLATTKRSAVKTNIQVEVSSFKHPKGFMIYPVKVKCLEILGKASQTIKRVGNCSP